MTVEIILGLFTGIIFCLVGIGGFILSKNKKWLFVLFFLVGSGATYIYTIGPISKSKVKLDSIINIDSKNIDLIIIKPTIKNKGDSSSFVRKDVRLVNRKSIDRICKVLNTSKHAVSGYLKGSGKQGQINVVTNLDTIKFGIKKRGALTGLYVRSQGETGWNYGTLKCDSLGIIIENMTKSKANM